MDEFQELETKGIVIDGRHIQVENNDIKKYFLNYIVLRLN